MIRILELGLGLDKGAKSVPSKPQIPVAVGKYISKPRDLPFGNAVPFAPGQIISKFAKKIG